MRFQFNFSFISLAPARKKQKSVRPFFGLLFWNCLWFCIRERELGKKYCRKQTKKTRKANKNRNEKDNFLCSREKWNFNNMMLSLSFNLDSFHPIEWKSNEHALMFSFLRTFFHFFLKVFLFCRSDSEINKYRFESTPLHTLRLNFIIVSSCLVLARLKNKFTFFWIISNSKIKKNGDFQRISVSEFGNKKILRRILLSMLFRMFSSE